MDRIEVDYKFKTAKASFSVGYDVCFSKVEREIHLPEFHAPNDTSVNWHFTIRPEEICFEEPSFRFLEISLQFESAIHKTLLVQCSEDYSQTKKAPQELYIKKHGDKGVSKSSFCVDSYLVCLPMKASESTLGCSQIAFVNATSNRLIIEATIRYCADSEDKHLFDVKGLPKELGVPFAGQKCVVDGLAALLASGELADATLEVGGEELPAHRAILAAQSDVFKAMFSTACSEKDSGKVAIKDMGLAVIKQLLRFLYTGSVDAGLDSVPELLVVADKYMVAGLRDLCQHRLENALLLHGASPAAPGAEDSSVLLCDSLRVAFLVDCASLRQVAVDHLRGHPELVRTPAWAELAAGPHRAAAALALLDAMAPAAGRSGQ